MWSCEGRRLEIDPWRHWCGSGIYSHRTEGDGGQRGGEKSLESKFLDCEAHRYRGNRPVGLPGKVWTGAYGILEGRRKEGLWRMANLVGRR